MSWSQGPGRRAGILDEPVRPQAAGRLLVPGTVKTKKDEWIEVKLPLDKFEATSFGEVGQGRRAGGPAEVNGLGFLLGDKKAGPFKLEVEWIKVVRAGASK